MRKRTGKRKGASGDALESRFVDALGVCLSTYSTAEVVEFSVQRIERPRLYITCNLNHLRVLQENAAFRRAYDNAFLVTADGRSFRTLVHLKERKRLPLVTGSDLFPRIIERCIPGVHRPFFLCSDEQVGQALVRRLEEYGFLPSDVAFSCPPFGFESDSSFGSLLIEMIYSHNCTHLFLGLGAPKSEVWVSENLGRLPPCHVFCIGAALEFFVGAKKRAPHTLQKLGAEWIFRASQEPNRLGKRYFFDALFLVKVVLSKNPRL